MLDWAEKRMGGCNDQARSLLSVLSGAECFQSSLVGSVAGSLSSSPDKCRRDASCM
jgi:hypothetical protein